MPLRFLDEPTITQQPQVQQPRLRFIDGGPQVQPPLVPPQELPPVDPLVPNEQAIFDATIAGTELARAAGAGGMPMLMGQAAGAMGMNAEALAGLAPPPPEMAPPTPDATYNERVAYDLWQRQAGQRAEQARPVGERIAEAMQTERAQIEGQDQTARRIARNSVPFVSTAIGGMKLDAVRMAANNIEAGQYGDDDIRVVGRFLAEQQIRADGGFGDQVLEVVSAMPAFMGELLMTGGTFRGASAGVKMGLKKVAKEAVERGVGKLATKAAAGTVGAVALAAANPQMVTSNTLRGTLPDVEQFTDEAGKVVDVNLVDGSGKSFLEALPAGFAESTVEVGSEMAGGMLSKGAGAILSRIPGAKRLSALRKGVIGSWLSKPGNTMAKFNQTLKEVGWNGIIGEGFEERFGDTLRLGLQLEGFDENVVGKLASAPYLAATGETQEALRRQGEAAQQLAVESAAFGIPGLAFAGVNAIGSRGGPDITTHPQQPQQPAAAPNQRPIFDVNIAEQWAQTNPDAAAAVAKHFARGKQPTRGQLENLGVPNSNGSTKGQRKEFARRVQTALQRPVQQPAVTTGPMPQPTEPQWEAAEQELAVELPKITQLDFSKGLLEGVGPLAETIKQVAAKHGVPFDELWNRVKVESDAVSATAEQPPPPTVERPTPMVPPPIDEAIPQPKLGGDPRVEVPGQAQAGTQEATQTPQGESQQDQSVLTPPVSAQTEAQQSPAPAAAPTVETPPAKDIEWISNIYDGAKIDVVEPSTDEERDAADFLSSRGFKARFIRSDDPKFRSAGAANTDTGDIYLVAGRESNSLWRSVGHEVAHASGFDKASEADEAIIGEHIQKRLDKASPKYKALMERNPELRRREGVAEMVGEFMSDPAFRDRLFKQNPGLWQRIREAILKAVSGFTPRDKAMREALEAIRTAKPPKKKITKPKPALGPLVIKPIFGGPETTIETPPKKGITKKTDESASPPQQRLAGWVEKQLTFGNTISREEFFSTADREFSGTRAQGTYGDSAAYDALELGVNKHIAAMGKAWSPATNALQAKERIRSIEKLQQRLPQHKARTGEKDTLQQFSTPPTYSYLANWVANVGPNDVMLEPSGGIGGIAVHAHNAGATVYANEIDEARASLLRQLPFAGVFTEDAERIAAILPGKMPNPTVVVMNPPFSRAGRRMGNKMMVGTDRKHIDEALKLLPQNGRLVAIIGAGLHGRGKGFERWLADLPHAVRADVEIGRDVYKGYGTTFPTRLLVIDKMPRDGRPTVSGSVAALTEAVDLLEDVRNERQPTSAESSQPESAEAFSGEPQPGDPAQPATGAVDSGQPAASDSVPSEPVPSRTTGDRPSNDGVGERTDSANTGSGRGKPSRSKPGTADAGGAASGESSRPSTEPDAEPTPTRDVANLETERRSRTKKRELTESTFEAYEPTVAVKGAQKHPASIVESAAMAAIDPPLINYRPKIDSRVIEGYTDADGVPVGVSDVQLEAIAFAGEAHSQKLPDGTRRGFMIGDGTGVGKAREIAGIILDNWNQNRPKAVWVSKNAKLYEPGRSEWQRVGGDKGKVFAHAKIASGEGISTKEGILYTTYSTLQQQASSQAAAAGNDKSRVDQVVDWLGEDFDGVLIFDESHEMGSAIDRGGGRYKKKASGKALAGVDLQNRLPNARIVYLSATSATEVANLAYASRLGLWGEGTPFPNREEFVNKITAGGVAAMEKVAADMKAMGMYLARNIAFNDGTEKGTVTYERLEHGLTEDQTRAWDKMAEAWQIVFRNMDDALELTGAVGIDQNGNRKVKDPDAVMRARSNFWSANQRFWNQVITAMQTPTAIKQVESSLEAGHSVVIQLTNTNEAAQKRALAGRKEDEDLEDVDVSPRYILMDYLERSFPTTAIEEYTDEEGNIRTRPVKDSAGNVVQDPEAVAMRERLLDQLGSLQVANRGALDMIVDRFGEDTVAEVTGRSERIVYRDGKPTRQRRGERAGKADINSFMDGRKRVLVFSEAGGTGASYHADLTRTNQEPRDHILLQPGWRADAAVQGLGRTHRSNQAQAPKYFLVHTNLKGQKRFISTIARRLAQLGALTKGQRTAGEAGVFSAADNLESTEAREALEQLFRDAYHNAIDFLTPAYLEEIMGLKIQDNQGNMRADLPPITQFLNRVLSLPVEQQNRVFDEFERRLEAKVEQATADGTLDQGMETVRADRIHKISEQTVYRHTSGAEAKHVVVKVGRKTKPVTWADLQRKVGPRSKGYVRSEKTGKVWAVEDTNTTVQRDDGRLARKLKLHSPTGIQYGDQIQIEGKNWTEVNESDAESNWVEQVKGVPALHEEDMHILSGVLLPIWDRMPEKNAQVKRLLTDEGEQILGRVIPADSIRDVLKRLGVSLESPKLTPQQVLEAVEDGATLVLSNDWKIKRSRVEGEWSIEIVGPDYSHQNELERVDIFSRRIDYKVRYFIPSGEKASDAIEAVTRNRPIVDVLRPSTRGSSGEVGSPNLYGVAPEEALSVTPVDTSKRKVSAPDVINAIKHIVLAAGRDVPIRIGRSQKLRKFAGVFKVGPEVIRLQSANDIPTAAHETGHALEKAMYGYPKGGPWTKARTTQGMRKELMKLGRDLYKDSKPEGGYKREGFAEYMRLLIVKPELAAQKSPAFHAWFHGTFLKDHPQVAKAIDTAQTLAVRWDKQGAKARAEASIIDPASFGQRVKRAKAWLADFLSRRNTIETSHPLYQLANTAEELSQGKLRPSENPYTIQAARRMTQHGIVKNWLQQGMTDLAGNRVGPSLSDAAALAKGKQKDFAIYLWARRAKALIEDPLGARDPGITLADTEQILSELETPEFALAASKVYAWQDGVLQYFADASPSNAAAVDAIRKRDPGDYIPLQREFDQLTKFWNQSMVNGNSFPLKRLRGSGRRIKDPFQTMVANATAMVTAAHKRMVVDSVIKLSRIEGIGKLVEPLPSSQVPGGSATVAEMIEYINKILEQRGDMPLDSEFLDDSVLGHLITLFMPAREIKSKPDEAIVPYYNNGQIEWYQVDPELLRTLSDQDVPRLGVLFDAFLSLPASIARAGSTTYRASFGLVTNPTRDVQGMYLNSRASGAGGLLLADYLKLLPRAIGSQVPVVGDQLQGEWFDLFKRLGGEMAQPMAQDFLSTRREVRRMFEGQVAKVLDFRNWFDFYRDLIQTPESVPRIAELKAVAREVGWEPGQPMTLDQSLEMLLAAKQVTTDFTAGGEIVKLTNRVIPFVNASVQGPRAGVRAFSRNKTKYLMKGLVAVTIPTLINWWFNKDEPWYLELTSREKFNYWHVPSDALGTLVRIPRGFEVGAVFAALPEALADAWYRQDPEAVREWFGSTFATMMPDFLPPPVQEAKEQLQNYDDYFEQPIVPRGELDLPAEEQFNEYTTKTSIFLGKMFKVSPRRIDHGIAGVGGPVTMDLLDVLGIGRKKSTREPELADAPIVGRLFQRGGKLGTSPKSVDKLYDAYSEALTQGKSRATDESPEQRERRLKLADGVKAVSALGYVRSNTHDTEQRQAITEEMVRVAKAAMSDAPRSEIAGDRKAAEIREASVKGSGDEKIGRLAYQLSDPRPRKKLTRRTDGRDPVAEWQETTDSARRALESTGNTDYATLRKALIAERKRRGESIASYDANMKLTPFGERLGRLKARLTRPMVTAN